MPFDRRHSLSEDELQKLAALLAPLIVETVQKERHNFWIEPQAHYDAHMEIRGMVEDYRTARGIFFKVFLSLVAAGATIAAAIGFFKGGTK